MQQHLLGKGKKKFYSGLASTSINNLAMAPQEGKLITAPHRTSLQALMSVPAIIPTTQGPGPGHLPWLVKWYQILTWGLGGGVGCSLVIASGES